MLIATIALSRCAAFTWRRSGKSLVHWDHAVWPFMPIPARWMIYAARSAMMCLAERPIFTGGARSIEL